MRISRLFVPETLAAGKKITLDDDGGHYLRTVLRLRKGDKITVFDGRGGEHQSLVYAIDRKGVVLEIGAWSDRAAESPLRVHLGLGIARGDRMDWVVQKAVELGAASLTPLITERTAAWCKGDKKREHWRKIVRHAAEQCGRTYVPKLADTDRLPDWLNRKQPGLKIFLDPRAPIFLNQLQPEHSAVILLAGPEGGFSPSERQLAEHAGFTPVRLGARILRTETASAAALAAVQTLWGDFRSDR